MVTVNEAKQKVIANTGIMSPVQMALTSAAGYVLAADVLAPFSQPAFRQSSMDGYAVLHSDITENGTALHLNGESRAGQTDIPHLQPGTAVRIFTGAQVPDEATAVIMQEHTRVAEGKVFINEFPVTAGKNVRRVGQQIQEGAVALPKGTVLSAGSIGFLQGMNIREVEVFRKPKIGILVTGDELLKAGEDLVLGKIYESNSAMLRAALGKEGIHDVSVSYAKDELDDTVLALQSLFGENDVVLVSGGISVGDYDYAGKALEQIGAETVFYKVRQKPGKPLLFARHGEKLAFALPGNPASSLVCFYEYVLPALRKMTGYENPFLRSIKLPIQNKYAFDGERDEFLKAKIHGDTVIPLDGQESFALRSFAIADALIYLPVTQNEVKVGELVEVHLLPF